MVVASAIRPLAPRWKQGGGGKTKVWGWETYGADVGQDLVGGLTLHQAHNDEERDRVEDGPDRHAVDEPLCQRVAQAELWPRRVGQRPRIALNDPVGGAAHAHDIAVTAPRARPHLNVILGALVRREPRRVGGECALQELLPEEVGRGGDEGEADEAQELDKVQSQGTLQGRVVIN